MMTTLEHLTDEERSTLVTIRESLRTLLGARLFRLVVFGSKVRGDFGEQSDLDLAIIVDGMDRTLKRTIIDAIGNIELDTLVPVSTFILSTGEFERMRAREQRIALDIENEGVAV